jgi:acyl-coenzyme A synthetase/AMP-(fatty) acid ligase/acyl carrier protein
MADVVFPESLRLTIIGGEKAQASSVTEWFRHAPCSIRLVNTYGPTEATVVSTIYEFSSEATWQNALIGRPLGNTEVYILDQFLQPVPVGVNGELYIGGDSLARGYLHQPELTAEKFISNPFASRPRGHLYKSGDQARYLSDGNIEFLGRLDQQIKIRGFRIELGEIEAVLMQHPAIREVVVIVREDVPGEKRLVAYPILHSGVNEPTTSELRNFVGKQMPEYMVPSAFVFLTEYPLTSNKKIDRKVLPEPDKNRPELEREFVAPRNEIEEGIARIFTNILKLEYIGIYDNFFDLGGHSLLATKVISRIRREFQIDLPLQALFMTPTVAGLSEAVDTMLWATQAQPTNPTLIAGNKDALEI